ncbi:hypothetical protein FPV67DRAFT_1445079 [Lyophyllum atratum]|nr:hypothetical protein FPV67DRAFT_1445079 [Lyophyllum atratum]
MAGRQRFTEKQRKVRHRQANSRYYARNIEQCREKARLYAQARRIRPKQQEKADVAGHTDAGQSLPPTDSLPMPTSSGNVEVKQASTVVTRKLIVQTTCKQHKTGQRQKPLPNNTNLPVAGR